MSNNMKIDYSSLKITNNIKDDNEVRPLIQEYVKSYQQEDNLGYLAILFAFVFFLAMLLLAVAVDK